MKIKKENIEIKMDRKMKIILMIVLFNLIFISVIIPVIAQQPSTDPTWCCLETTSGQYCREYPPENISQYCDMSDPTNIHQGSCEETSCEVGCCYNAQKQCITGSVETECNSNAGSTWFDNAGCNLQQCQQGCCLLGAQSIYTTTEGCNLWADSYGLPKTFHLGVAPEECYELVNSQAYGACLVDEQGGCIFTTREQCSAQTGDYEGFNEGYLCSHSELNTNCEARDYTGCVDGKHEVYWFDSCGNQENIFGTSPDGGEIRSKSESCTLDLNSNQASCGNCNIGSSICGLPIQGKDVDPNDGDYVCRDMRCVDEQGNIRDNGESWCIYEGKVGEGKDVAGSSHWMYYCQNGEVKSENCDEKREKICVQEIVDDFSTASCIENEWERCIDYNIFEEGENWLEEFIALGDRIKNCEEDDFCNLKRMYLGKPEVPGTEIYAVCVPKWPVGFDLENKGGKEAALDTCGLGSKRMVCSGGDYEKCFTELNDLCINLGDCGGYVNIEGEYTEGGIARFFGVNKGGSKSWIERMTMPASQITEYISNAEPEPDYFISVEDLIPEDYIYDPFNYPLRKTSTPRYGGRKKTKVIPGTLYFSKSNSKFRNNKLVPGFNCLPWEAPKEGVCEDCNLDPLKPCTPYRCQSMGKNCKLVNEGSVEYELCFRSQEYDLSPPVITPLEGVQSSGLSYKIYPSVNGYQLWNNARSDGCIQAHSEISFGIETDEPAVCRFSQTSISYSPEFEFSSLPELFGEHNYLDFNHALNESLPSIESMANYYDVDFVDTVQTYGNFEYYIRCEDSNGKSNINEYVVRMCVNPEPDIQAPFVRGFMPPENNYFRYGVTEYPFHVWTDEQADCRITENVIDQNNYNAMIPMDCKNNYTDKEFLGWRCSAELTGLTNNKEYYILCKDKPWLPENNETRRLMAQSRKYTVRVTEKPLTISSLTINSQGGDNLEVFSNTDYASVTLDVVTSGGADEGEPLCHWRQSETSGYSYFKETQIPATPNNHRQVWSALNNGTHTIEIYCVDNIGNNVTNITTFTISKDTAYPIVVRMYYDNRQLKIITHEDANCQYSNNFTDNWANKSLMSTSDHRLHTAPWDEDLVYYIQCEDNYFNRIPFENQIEIASYEDNPNP